MPRYTFNVANADTVLEMTGVDLPDNETARECAIAFAAELFRSHNDICSDQWHLCSLHVLNSDETEVFATSVPEAAMMERDSRRINRGEAVNH